MIEDGELLESYALEGNESAFESLVNRYVNLVYSAAWRQTGDREQARNVTQAVFANRRNKARHDLDSVRIGRGFMAYLRPRRQGAKANTRAGSHARSH